MLAPGDRIGKYEVLATLGSGHFGRVYRVRDDALGREVALKIIPTTNADAVKTLVEAQAQNLCRHDNCVHVTMADVVVVQGDLSVLIEMEYLPAGSLQSRLNAGFLSCAEAIRHICQILYALEFAHSNGILHRDVKPGNILLSIPHTKLSDFGIAYDLSRPGVGYNVSYSSHASPQLAAGFSPEKTDDVFSAGVTLFRLVNNYANWSAARAAVPNWSSSVRAGTLIKDIGHQDFVPDALRRIIRRACHPDADRRYPSCADFRQALERLKFNCVWERDNSGDWRCQTESLTISGDRVEHRVNGRRRLANCKRFANPQAANDFGLSLVAASILQK